MLIRSLGTEYEDNLRQQGFETVAGVDEVGRGPLAGPVVACALILPPGLNIEGVNDSKKLSARKREAMATIIKDAALAHAFGIVDVETIDRINILQATLLAMKKAIDGLETTPTAVLVDGTTPPNLSIHTICVPQGDAKSQLIAAASILAKVHRDAMMAAIHTEYPQYGFDAHKGYGTAKHRAAVEANGLCPHHRKSFCKGWI